MKTRKIPSGLSNSLSAKMGARTRLEILTALSQALLREVSALQDENEKSTGSEVVGETVREIDLAKEIESYEADLIRSALMQTSGRQRQAARLLNVKTSTLNAKIKRYGLLESTPMIFQGLG